MQNVQILDCTLRDGGRIFECRFDDKTIFNMTKDLTFAGIDIVELGFLRDGKLTEYKGNSTFFTEISEPSFLLTASARLPFSRYLC